MMLLRLFHALDNRPICRFLSIILRQIMIRRLIGDFRVCLWLRNDLLHELCKPLRVIALAPAEAANNFLAFQTIQHVQRSVEKALY